MTTTPEQMSMAIDAHIAESVKSFMGSENGAAWVRKTKESLGRKAVECASG
jgi:hypothetical protein